MIDPCQVGKFEIACSGLASSLVCEGSRGSFAGGVSARKKRCVPRRPNEHQRPPRANTRVQSGAAQVAGLCTLLLRGVGRLTGDRRSLS